jgi:hypothetical protein
MAIEAHYALVVGNRIGLAVGRYDATRPLIIDPTLVYSTYLGGSNNDEGVGIAVDARGHRADSIRLVRTHRSTDKFGVHSQFATTSHDKATVIHHRIRR